jgi:hypothetical protein
VRAAFDEHAFRAAAASADTIDTGVEMTSAHGRK